LSDEEERTAENRLSYSCRSWAMERPRKIDVVLAIAKDGRRRGESLVIECWALSNHRDADKSFEKLQGDS
jgi:hypothetical protein